MHIHTQPYYGYITNGQLNLSLQSSLTNDLVEKTENEKALLAAAKEENEKLKEVLQSEINEYKVSLVAIAHP